MIQPSRRKPALLGTHKAILNGLTVPYAVKRSSRAKHARLEVRAGIGLTVVIPGSYKTNDILDLLRKKERWILDKLTKYVKGHPIIEGKEPKSGDSIPYLGRLLKVVTRHNSGTVAGVKLEKNRLLVDLNSRNGRLNLVLEWWYRRQAEKLIKERADELCSQLEVVLASLADTFSNNPEPVCAIGHHSILIDFEILHI
ncbi:MAG: YgjP-like metallopeptidase domain-containing protein [Chloroflexota bacterium]